MRLLLIGLSLVTVTLATTPVCGFVQTTFPNCSTVCTASCQAANCTTSCASGTCSVVPKCTYDCSMANYTGSTCPNCTLAPCPLNCPPADNCTAVCAPKNCSWSCVPTSASRCEYPRFELQCQTTFCATASTIMWASILALFT